MIVTKEMLILMAVVTTVTGAVFSVILSSGATSLNELKILVYARAELTNDIMFLTYTIINTGDYDIQNVTVTTTNCCAHVVTLYNPDATPLLNVMGEKDYMDIVPVTGLVPGDEIIVQFDALDTFGNRDVDILTVILQ